MKYFLHDSNAFNDEKITLLYMEFGFEALGLFYTILEKLSAQEKPVLESVLKSQLKIGKKLKKQLEFMYKIDILSTKDGEVFSETLLNFSEKYSIKKEKNRKRISQWRDRQKDTENVTCYESVRNTAKVKESKVKESKVIDYADFILKFNEITDKKIRVACDKFKKQFKERLKNGYTVEEILKAVKNCANDPYHIDNNLKYLTPEFITRSDKLEKWVNVSAIDKYNKSKNDFDIDNINFD